MKPLKVSFAAINLTFSEILFMGTPFVIMISLYFIFSKYYSDEKILKINSQYISKMRNVKFAGFVMFLVLVAANGLFIYLLHDSLITIANIDNRY